jgi:hypothetical protein
VAIIKWKDWYAGLTTIANWVKGLGTAKALVRATDIEDRLGDLDDAAVIDPEADASVIAALKGLLTKLSGDPATQTTLAAILAKLIEAPATSALQTAGNGSLALVLAQLKDTIIPAIATGNANTATTIVLPAVSGYKYEIYGYLCIVKEAESINAVNITLTDDATEIWGDGIKAETAINGGVGFAFSKPLLSTAANKTFTIAATAGGVSVITRLQILYKLVVG